MVIKKYSGWKKYFTFTYWKLQLERIIHRKKPLNIIETFTIEIKDKGKK